MAHRRMADPAFRDGQRAALHDARTTPVTAFVDELRADGRWAPYVAPMHGGIDARVLSILRDPGPATRNTPDVVVLRADGRIAYRGAPDADVADDSLAAGWLRSALDRVLEGGDPNPATTEVVGCAINWTLS